MPRPDLLLSVLLTAALQSALLCAAALIVERFVRAPGSRSQLHRAAAAGVVLTTLVAFLGGAGPAVTSPSFQGALGEQDDARPITLAADATVPAGAALTGAPDSVPSVAPRTPADPRPWILLGWGVVAAALLVRDVVVRRRFAAALRREPLGRSTPGGAALSLSDALDSPVVLSGREVCVPRGLWLASSTAERTALVAHEDAHIARRDPAWRSALGSLRALLWFQPLLPLVLAREARAAELDCDDRAVRGGAGALSLARVLASVAETGLRRRAPFPAMARSRPLVVERVARLTTPGRTPLGATGRLSVAGLGLGLVLFACAAPRVRQPNEVDALLPRVDAMLPYVDAIVVEVDAERRAQLFAPGETVPRATADLADRREQSRLGRALAAVCADPSLPIRTGLPAGIPTEVAPYAHSNPYVVRIGPDTRFAAVQHLMAQGADPDSALWNFVLEVDGRTYGLPLPIDVPGRLAELYGVKATLRRDGADGALRIGVGEAWKQFYYEVEEESEDVEAARAEVRWVDLDGFEAIVREGVAAGHTAIEIDPRAGTTVADVTPLLDIIERIGGGRLQVSLSGSYE